MKDEGRGVELAGLAVVRDVRDAMRQAPVTSDELADLETDVFAQFVFARASAGMADATIDADLRNLDLVRAWLGRPIWEMTPGHADRYFGKELRKAASSTRAGKAASLRLFFQFLEQRYKEEIYVRTGCVVEPPLDEINRPRGERAVALRVPPTQVQMELLFAGWRHELATTRRYATCARDYTVARLMAAVGPRINEVRRLDLDDIHPELGNHGKVHIRFGKGSNGSGPRARFAPLIAGADALLRWYVEDVRGLFGDDGFWDRPGTALFPAERVNPHGGSCRVSAENLRQRIVAAGARHRACRDVCVTDVIEYPL